VFSSNIRVVVLVLFYAGIGLTALYSLRLVSLLSSPVGHFHQGTCSGSLPLAVAFPLVFLLGLSVLQGHSLFAGLFTSSVVLLA